LATTITTTNNNPGLINLASERQVYNEYYEEDDEDFEESLSSQATNSARLQPSTTSNSTAGMTQPSNPSNLASINSNVVSNLNRIDINELFDAYGEEEGAAAAAAAAAVAYVERRAKSHQHRPVDEEDEDEEEEDIDEEEEEEYGDDFNENFVIGYEHVVDQQIAAAAVAAAAAAAATTSSSSSNNQNRMNPAASGSSLSQSNVSPSVTAQQAVGNFNLANVAATGRDAIYQDLMSTITAAAAAISGRIQTQISSGNSTTTAGATSNTSTRAATTTTTANPSTTTTTTTAVSSNNNQSESVKNQAKTNKNANYEDMDETELNSKLCTFTVTKKDFKNQHWYYCHTCKMVDRIGMCTICAKVCHKDHDVSYAKYGSFFCDCGAKEDGSCLAMTKRTSVAPKSDSTKKEANKEVKKINIKKLKKKKSSSTSSSTTLGTSKQQQQQQQQQQQLENGLKDKDIEFLSGLFKQNTVELLRKLWQQIRVNKSKQLEKLRGQLVDCIKAKDLLSTIRDILEVTLIPLAKKTYDSSLLNTNSFLARSELAKLKHQNLSIPSLSQLSVMSGTSSDELKSVDDQKSLVSFNQSNMEQQPLFIVTLGEHYFKLKGIYCFFWLVSI
jgi:ribosomal protein L12E/L44/L45/RPP1/RPP2